MNSAELLNASRTLAALDVEEIGRCGDRLEIERRRLDLRVLQRLEDGDADRDAMRPRITRKTMISISVMPRALCGRASLGLPCPMLWIRVLHDVDFPRNGLLRNEGVELHESGKSGWK